MLQSRSGRLSRRGYQASSILHKDDLPADPTCEYLKSKASGRSPVPHPLIMLNHKSKRDHSDERYQRSEHSCNPTVHLELFHKRDQIVLPHGGRQRFSPAQHPRDGRLPDRVFRGRIDRSLGQGSVQGPRPNGSAKTWTHAARSSPSPTICQTPLGSLWEEDRYPSHSRE